MCAPQAAAALGLGIAVNGGVVFYTLDFQSLIALVLQHRIRDRLRDVQPYETTLRSFIRR